MKDSNLQSFRLERLCQVGPTRQEVLHPAGRHAKPYRLVAPNGAADLVFTVSYAGFVNGETPAVLGGTLAVARAPSENFGSYLITPGGLTSDNYVTTFNPGTLAITAPAPVRRRIAPRASPQRRE